MTKAAPVLNKVVTSPPARAEEADTARIRAAIHFGAALQELVARARLHRDGPPPDGETTRFPEDLALRRDPQDALWATYGRLLKLERELVPEAALPVPQPQMVGPWGAGPVEAPLGSENGHEWLEPAGSPSGAIAEKIQQLLDAHAEDANQGNLYSHLSGEGGLDQLIGDWDAYVVGRIAVSYPRVMVAYKVGKALGRTRWQVHTARREGTPAWDFVFGARRVREMQRQINALNDALDPTALTVVATNLGYWRNTLLGLPAMIANPGEPATTPKTIEVPADKEDELEEALDRQLDNWLDLLTGRRAPESFPVAGIVSNLTRNMAEALANTPASRITRYMIPFFAIIALLAILATLILGALILYPVIFSQPEANEAATTVGGEAGGLAATGVAGIIATLLVRGRSLAGRASENFDVLRGRLDSLDVQLGKLTGGEGKASEQATTTLGLTRPSWQGLKDDVISQLVAQIRLEELNIAACKPLVDFVLALNDRDTNDPMEDAQRFLNLVYGKSSNLDRLLPAFKSLYKNFRISPPA